MSSRTSDLISPKVNVGMLRRGADLIRREDENRLSELPSGAPGRTASKISLSLR